MKIKLTFWKVVFFVIMALGIYSSFIRYFRGLGAVSNMSDQFPWGLWIGFDCLCGVMLAAGGFCMVGAVYLFNVESCLLYTSRRFRERSLRTSPPENRCPRVPATR